MAGPKLTDGYTQIANEILEALVAHKMSDRKRTLALLILRLTYGWKRSEVRVSQAYIAQVTGIDKGNVSRTLAAMEADGLLLCSCRASFVEPGVYGLQKRWTEWKLPLIGAPPKTWGGVAKTATPLLPKQQQGCCQNDNSTVAKTTTLTPLKRSNGAAFGEPKERVKKELNKVPQQQPLTLSGAGSLGHIGNSFANISAQLQPRAP